MRKLLRWTAPLALLLGLAVARPGPATAREADRSDVCYEDYMWCLNDTWDTKGFARLIADVRCGAEWALCMFLSVVMPE